MSDVAGAFNTSISYEYVAGLVSKRILTNGSIESALDSIEEWE
jgi:hypothetical protein